MTYTLNGSTTSYSFESEHLKHEEKNEYYYKICFYTDGELEQILNEKSKGSLTDLEDIQEVNNTNVFDEIMPGSFEDRAFACIVGAFVGDACETVFEFQKEVIDEKRMAECMQMVEDHLNFTVDK